MQPVRDQDIDKIFDVPQMIYVAGFFTIYGIDICISEEIFCFCHFEEYLSFELIARGNKVHFHNRLKVIKPVAALGISNFLPDCYRNHEAGKFIRPDAG